MGKLVQTILNIVINVINAIPVLKGYRTFILTIIQVILIGLDQFGVGSGDLWHTAAPLLVPLTTATALGHGFNNSNN